MLASLRAATQLRQRRRVLDTWRHFALAVNSVHATLYWDGRRLAETDYRGTLISSAGFPPWLCIGAQFSETSFPNPERTLAGRVDEFALWTRSLSEIEIDAVYHAGLSGRDISHLPSVLDVRMTISHSAGLIVISWPLDVSGYVLQSSPSLSPAAWTPVLDVVNNRVTLTRSTGTAFFRLAEP